MGLLSKLDRLAARVNRSFGRTAVAASAEHGGYGGDATVNPAAVKLGLDEVDAATHPEDEPDER